MGRRSCTSLLLCLWRWTFAHEVPLYHSLSFKRTYLNLSAPRSIIQGLHFKEQPFIFSHSIISFLFSSHPEASARLITARSWLLLLLLPFSDILLPLYVTALFWHYCPRTPIPDVCNSRTYGYQQHYSLKPSIDHIVHKAIYLQRK